MFDFFEKQKRRILGFLERELTTTGDPLARVNRFGAEALKLLLEFTRRGKMIRGGLVGVGYALFRDGESDSAAACGAALELLQSALLIHDDIMDRDLVRRGEKTIPARYADEACARGLAEPEHIGEALGTCLGDIGFFLAFRILGEMDAPQTVVPRLVALFAREMTFVGAAQMLDVWAGAEKPAERGLTEEEILDLYRYKTGRYTFALPLAAGALLAEREDVAPPLEAIGEDLGVIFQIKDDALDLFGEERAIGKPVGSDLREGKQTLLLAGLARALDGSEKKRFFSLWGKAGLTPAEIAEVRDLVRGRGLLERAAETVDDLAGRCRRSIEALDLPRPEKRGTLEQLLEYSLGRTR
jgi:geranylgeranyl diphosphate synthase type I